MTPFQCNETALHQPTAYCMLDTTDDKRIQCLLIGLATYFLLAAFMLDTKIGRYFISIAETIDLVAVLSGRGSARRLSELTRVEGLGPDGDYRVTPAVSAWASEDDGAASLSPSPEGETP